MPREFGTRTQVALLLYTTLNVAVFTAGVYVVMLSPALLAEAGFWIAVVVAVSLVAVAPVAWCMASCLCNERWRRKIVATPSQLASEPTREF